MKKALLILLSVFLLTACGEKKIDASTPIAFKTSVQELAKDLNEKEQQEYKDAVAKIMQKIIVDAKGDGEKTGIMIKEQFGGKTVKEVIEMAKNN